MVTRFAFTDGLASSAKYPEVKERQKIEKDGEL